MRRDEARIVTPCAADWSTMTPVEARQRLCAECNKSVHDLSAMSEDEARRALRSGPICVRYVHDAQGNILHRIGKAAIAASAVVTALLYEACGGTAGGFDELPGEPDAEPDADPADDPTDAAPSDARPPHVYPDAGVPDAAEPDGG